MTELSRRILENFQVRKTFRQKSAFIDLLKEYFPDLSVQKFSFLNCRNLIVGDVESAEIILSAHYDTCARSITPNFIAPKNPPLTYLYAVLAKIPIIAILILFNVLLGRAAVGSRVHWFCSVILYFLLVFLMFLGPANKHTANDNTSGVIVLCELLGILSQKSRKNVAFVFFDHEESGLVGSSLFRKKYKKVLSNKVIINFDCVSDGEHVMIAANKAARKLYGDRLKDAFSPTETLSILFTNAEKAIYPSDQKSFPKNIVITVLKHKWYLGYYLDRIHTNADINFKQDNIRHICNCMLRFLTQ